MNVRTPFDPTPFDPTPVDVAGGARPAEVAGAVGAVDQVATMRRVIEVAGRVIDAVEPAQLGDPTPCTSWTVRDVVNHVVAWSELFATCIRDGAISDRRFRELSTTDRLGDDFRAAFHGAADDAIDAFARPGTRDRLVELPFGPMPGHMALDIFILDVATHAWDLATATGQPTDLDAHVVQRASLAAQTLLSEELRATGRFGPAVTVADDASPTDRLAAFTGRVP